MRHTIFIFIILFAISKPGLCWQFDQLDTAFGQAITIDDYKKCLSKFIADSTLISANELVNREIDFDCSQVIYSLRQAHFEFEVYLILRNDTIVIGKLQELDYFDERKVIKSNIFTLRPKIVETYLDKYFSYYEIKVSRQDFVNQMTLLEKYGFGCGLHRGFFSQSAKETKEYVDTQNYEQLARMLRSPVPEIKAYGATGLIQLEKAGLKINAKEKMIINHYMKVNFAVYSCYGCLSGTESFRSILDWEYE